MSEIQIYSENRQLILVVDGVRILLNLSAAEQLHLALGQTIPLLKSEVLAAKEAVAPLEQALRHAHTIWKPQFEPQRQLSLDLMLNGHIDMAFDALALVCGADMAWAGFADMFELHTSGWSDLKPEYHSAEALIALSILAVRAPVESDLGFLWREHAWDFALRVALAYCDPTTVDATLHQRLWEWLLDQQDMPPGRFVMGSEAQEAWPFESPCHEVQLSQPIHMSRYLITQFVYLNIMGHNPSKYIGALRPVEGVSWIDACHFCNALSLKQGLEAVYQIDDDGTVHWNPYQNGYRLPTEAEWERAAKGSQNFQFAGSNTADEIAWFADNTNGETKGVGQKKPNGFGLYDMCGNVWEWCWDGYVAEFYSHSAASWDPVGSLECSEHVCRGGSYLDKKSDLRVSLRGRFEYSTRWSALGFRVVLQKPYQALEQDLETAVLRDMNEEE